MKYKVLTRFNDKYTSVLHETGTFYETDSQERAEELQKGGYIGEEVKNPLASVLEKNVTEVKNSVTRDNYSVEQITELIALEEAGEKRKGVKEHLNSLLKEEKDESSAV